MDENIFTFNKKLVLGLRTTTKGTPESKIMESNKIRHKN